MGDKKKVLDKEIKAVEAKLEVTKRFKDTVKVIEDFCGNLTNFDNVLKSIDEWMQKGTAEFKDELARITVYVQNLSANTIVECDKYSNDVKYWAEYRTGIKEFTPWLVSAEKAASEGLSKPSDLSDVKALNAKVLDFNRTTDSFLKVLDAAN